MNTDFSFLTTNRTNNTNIGYRCYFRFLQFSLGLYEGKEFLEGDGLDGFDWNDFYRFAQSQTLVGVLFDGIQKLSKQNAPKPDLLLKWMGQSQLIRKQNYRLNIATTSIYNKVKVLGYRCSILKGQGNAIMYPNAYSRTPGDIDVWVNARREDIRRLANSLAERNGCIGKESLNHIEMTVDGVAVELHSTPGIMANPVYDHRLQKWLRRNADLQCGNIVNLPDVGKIAVPTVAFNAVYQLYHLYHHYFYEGVGLRQVVDYYYVLKNEELRIENLDALQRELKWLGLWKFAGAMMFVLHEVLGGAEARMIAPIDEKRGEMLLYEILSGGNFGRYDKRTVFGNGVIGHNIQRLCHDARLGWLYPAEALSEPIYRLFHWWWRMKNKRTETKHY